MMQFTVNHDNIGRHAQYFLCVILSVASKLPVQYNVKDTIPKYGTN